MLWPKLLFRNNAILSFRAVPQFGLALRDSIGGSASDAAVARKLLRTAVSPLTERAERFERQLRGSLLLLTTTTRSALATWGFRTSNPDRLLSGPSRRGSDSKRARLQRPVLAEADQSVHGN